MDKPAPQPAIDGLGFLARSEHRIQLLRELSSVERPRRELQDGTGISQPTLGRILNDFDQRGWVANHHNGAYSLTPLGALLADAVDDLLDVLDTVTRLADLAEHLPWDRLDVDHRHLVDARVTTPSPSEPLAHMRRFDELASRASTVRVFSNVLSCAPADDSLDADREFLTEIDEMVVTGDGLATGLDDSALRQWLRRRVDQEDLALFRYEEPARFLLGVFDGNGGIVPIDDAGMPCGLIEAETGPLRTWVGDTFEAYRDQSTRLTADALSE